jgi:NAD(P)-dependent dehydrogenase (short-subunit alcohol dehydrogenase family)
MAVALVRSDILYAWKGPSLLIVSMRGECSAEHPLSGLYFREARFLRTLRLEINGERPWLCETASLDPESLAMNFVHPEIEAPGGGGTGQSGDEETLDAHGIPERSLDIRLSYHVDVAGLDVVLAITNRARGPVHFELAWDLGADYADIQEAQAGRREQQSAVHIAAHAGRIEFAYGHAALPYRTEVRHDGRWQWRGEQAVTELTLQPRQTEELRLRVIPLTGRDDISGTGATERETTLRTWRNTFAHVEVPGNRLFERVLEYNVRDVASFPLLDGARDEWLAMQAGMPLYPAFFGRDAVTAGWQAGFLDRGQTLSAALIKLGRLQSDRFDDWRDEQPSRIPYQVRTGPLALLNLNPYSAYLGQFAAVSMYGRTTDVSIEDMRRQMDVNYWGQVYGSRVAVRHMRGRGGALINVASALADRAIPLQGNYCAAKHALKAFTDTLRMELQEEGMPISVTLVKPASIDTPFFEKAKTYLGVEPQPVPPVYAPEVVSEVILRAAQRPLRELIAGGSGVKLSAARFVPRLADLYMQRWTFGSQRTDASTNGRADNLYTPLAEDGGERGRNWTGHVRGSSMYTKAGLHPALTAAVSGALAVTALVLAATCIFHRRR